LAWFSLLVAPLMGYRNYRLRRILARAGRVIAPTEFVRRAYLQMGISSDNMMVIPHGIDVPQDRIAKLRSQRVPSPANTLHVGYIGSLAWQKGVHHLIAAFNELPGEGVSLTLYGDLDKYPAYVAQLRESASHQGIRFAGRVSRDELWGVMAGFDVLVLPTLWYEASPLTIQEAHAVGVPLIASRIGAMSEKINDNVDGILLPPGDPAAIRDTLRSLLLDRDILTRLQAGIRPVYTISEQARELEKVYSSLV
jgi:glycosyltransferase involved in cell wall biosynthesis